MTTNVTKVAEQALVAELAGPVLLTESIQQALIQDIYGPSSVVGVVHQTLIVTEPPPGTTNVSLTKVSESALIVDPLGPPFVTGIDQRVITQVEAPFVQLNLTSVHHSALIPDSFYGRLLAAKVSNSVILQTELPTRSPDRVKIVGLQAAARRVYLDPSVVIPRYRLKPLTISSGSNKIYPSRVISNARLASAVTQIVQPTTADNPLYVMSMSRIASTYSLAAVSSNIGDPTTIISDARQHQATVLTLHAQQFVNPVSISASYQSQQVANSLALKQLFNNPEYTQSQSQLQHLSCELVCGISYQYPPQSQTQVQTIKVELPFKVNNFLNPLDIKSTVQTNAIKVENVVIQPFEDPITIRSTEQTTQLTTMMSHAISFADPSELHSNSIVSGVLITTASASIRENPGAIEPSGREYQLTHLLATQTPKYEDLPKSQIRCKHESHMVAQVKNVVPPDNFSPSARALVIAELISVRRTYADPATIVGRRRNSSTRVVYKRH